MITLSLLIFALAIIAIILLVLTGIVVIAWPILIILGIGLLIDIIFFKLIFHKKK